MNVCTTPGQLRDFLQDRPGAVAFVPTMGALHDGHLALIDAARALGGTVVASVFVNPTQFNDPEDLRQYPRTPAEDDALLRGRGCDVLFVPTVPDVYPADYNDPTRGLDFGELVSVMEGARRTGHFDGVAQVVYRLLDLVRPDVLILGQKDYQQVAVIRRMIDLLELEVAVRVVPTVREADGLALSSRNRRLGRGERRAAATINLHLKAVAAAVRAGWNPRDLEVTAVRELDRHELLRPEYVSVFDGDTLQPWRRGTPAREVVVATAVHCGPVRLIDNLIVRSDDPTNANS